MFPIEVFELYSKVMEYIFTSRGSNKKKETLAIQKDIEGVEAKLLKLELKYANDEIELDSFQRVKAVYQKEIIALKGRKSELESMKDDYDEYLSFGITLLSNLDVYYQKSSIEGKRCLISSIFGEKLLLYENHYRTFFLNTVVASLASFGKDLERSRIKKSDAKTSLVLSGTPGSRPQKIQLLRGWKKCVA